MAIQNRRGEFKDFKPSKLKEGEWATVLSGDPNASDGRSTYLSYGNGIIKRMATYEDMEENIQRVTDDIIQEITTGVNESIESANNAAQKANNAADKITNILNTMSNATSRILWSGTASKEETILVPDLDKYSIIWVEAYANDFIAPVICVRHGEYIIGGQMTENISADGIVFSMVIALQATPTGVRVYKARIMAHSPSSGHNAGIDVTIRRIVGLVPDFSKFIE